MTSDSSGWSTLLLAVAGLITAVSAIFLNRRGQNQQSIQQAAANDLARRAQGFDEMERLADARQEEVDRVNTARDRERNDYDRDLASVARRCRSSLDLLTVAFANLQGQVVSEQAKSAAVAALAEVERHKATEHPEGERA